MTEAKKSSPIRWVPTAYFAMGLPFVVLNMVTVLMFKGLGVEDKLITFWTSLILLPWTLKPLWSPFLELFKTKKFFRHPDSAGHRRYLWISRICAEPAPFLQYLHRPTGHHCLQRSDTRHRLRRSIHE